jgi:Protein similar to CwfJ C-terminus 1
VAVDKGAIGDGHVLVLPIEHYPNSLGVPPSTAAEMDRYLAALQSCYAAQASGCTLTVRDSLVASTLGGNAMPCYLAHTSCAL